MEWSLHSISSSLNSLYPKGRSFRMYYFPEIYVTYLSHLPEENINVSANSGFTSNHVPCNAYYLTKIMTEWGLTMDESIKLFMIF